MLTPGRWHQPAMVVCTFLENYDLSKHVIVPFATYGATTYLNETMQTICRSTSESVHMPAVLPEDLDPDDIPGNARGVEGWLTRPGRTDNSGVACITVPTHRGRRGQCDIQRGKSGRKHCRDTQRRRRAAPQCPGPS